MKKTDYNSRRRFLKQMLSTSVCLPLGMGTWSRAAQADFSFSDYKALVCIFLYGGADSSNMIVPISRPEYNLYSTIRAGLGVDRSSLLPITPTTPQSAEYGFNSAFSPLHPLFEAGEMAVVANVGTLLEPSTKTQLINHEVAIPPQLFSHSDQQFQWATAISDTQHPIGWGGRVADLFGNVNGPNALSMNITMAGQSVFLTGEQVIQYALSSEGPERLAFHDFASPGDPLYELHKSWLNKDYDNILQREFAKIQNRAISLEKTISNAMDQLSPLTTTFPNTDLGAQLQMVARMIQARDLLGEDPIKRQIYLVGAYGWDTHDDQNAALPRLLGNLSTCMRSFNDAIKEIGVNDEVTAFTSSEFGRTLTNNGDGTDHGWGGHQLVVGGAVQGGNIYGLMPDLTLGGPNDAGQGRMIPTQSVDQFNATLARWFGVPDTDMGTLFPYLSRFPRQDLGFMAG